METSKFKLAIVIDVIDSAGVGKALQEFIKQLSKSNVQITVFARNIDPKIVFSLPDNTKLQNWGNRKTITDYLWQGKLFECFRRGYYIICEIVHLRNCFKKVVYETRQLEKCAECFDCAIAYQMISNETTAFTMYNIQAKRKVLWLHGEKKFRDKDIRFYNRLYSNADAIVCVSSETEKKFLQSINSCKNKTTTIHNFFDVEAINNLANEPVSEIDNSFETVVVSVGRLSKEKGFDRVTDVALRLKKEGIKFKWYIIGDGCLRTAIAELINSLNLTNEVILTGYRGNPYPYIKNCDIYVQPSYTEGFCTTTMEAKILKKIVVTTDVPGMNEQFDNEQDGLIVESSVEGLYEGITRVIQEPLLKERIQSNLSKVKYENERILQQVYEVIGIDR